MAIRNSTGSRPVRVSTRPSRQSDTSSLSPEARPDERGPMPQSASGTPATPQRAWPLIETAVLTGEDGFLSFAVCSSWHDSLSIERLSSRLQQLAGSVLRVAVSRGGDGEDEPQGTNERCIEAADWLMSMAQALKATIDQLPPAQEGRQHV